MEENGIAWNRMEKNRREWQGMKEKRREEKEREKKRREEKRKETDSGLMRECVGSVGKVQIFLYCHWHNRLPLQIELHSGHACTLYE